MATVNGKHFTGVDLLHQFSQRLADVNLNGQVFEGLELVRDVAEEPIYDLCTAS